jgi:hypothetical protein
MRVSRRGVVAATLAAVVAGACNPFAAPAGLDPMTLAPAPNSSVEVTRGSERLEVTDRFSIEPGDVIRTSSSPARIQLVGDRRASLSQHTSIRVNGTDSLEALSGSLLVVNGDPVVILFEGVEGSTRTGIFRVDTVPDTSTSTASAYSGSIDVSDGPTIPPFFELDVTEGAVGDLNPVELNREDRWTAFYLGDAIELNQTLADFDSTLRTLLGDRFGDVGALSRVLPGIDARFIARLLESDGGSATDLLIAYSLAEGDQAPARGRVRRAWHLHARGVPWGAVASIMRVEGSRLVTDLQSLGSELINESPSGAEQSGSGNASTRGGSSAEREGTCVSIIDCILDS